MEKKELQLQEKLVNYIRLTWDRRLTESTGGNMSVRIGDKVYITPTGFVKHFMTIDDLVVLDLSGNKIGGKLNVSSEYRMHLKLYNEREDIKSVFHAHPRYALIHAFNHKEIPIKNSPENIYMLSGIEYIPYHMAGTDEFADAFAEGAKKGKTIFMLYNHGVTTCGDSIESAYAKLESLETCCFTSILGGLVKEQPKDISAKEINDFVKKMGINLFE